MKNVTFVTSSMCIKLGACCEKGAIKTKATFSTVIKGLSTESLLSAKAELTPCKR